MTVCVSSMDGCVVAGLCRSVSLVPRHFARHSLCYTEVQRSPLAIIAHAEGEPGDEAISLYAVTADLFITQ